MGSFRGLYSVWVILSMAVCFLIYIIPQILCIPFTKAHFLALRINYLWGWTFFRLALIPVKIEWRFDLNQYPRFILCANHFSYLDIPALGMFPKPFKFVGKSQLNKIPLFGLMYNYIHITVNRSSYRSRAESLAKARNAIQQGFNLGFFPEGGIRTKQLPQMVNFQDGAFRLAAENDIPIIPVTFLDNYRILEDDRILSISRQTCKVIYHEPLKARDESEDSIKKLKQEVYRVIQDELNMFHQPETADVEKIHVE